MQHDLAALVKRPAGVICAHIDLAHLEAGEQAHGLARPGDSGEDPVHVGDGHGVPLHRALRLQDLPEPYLGRRLLRFDARDGGAWSETDHGAEADWT